MVNMSQSKIKSHSLVCQSTNHKPKLSLFSIQAQGHLPSHRASLPTTRCPVPFDDRGICVCKQVYTSSGMADSQPLLLLLSCAKSHMLSASRRQPHLLHVGAVDRWQIWSMDKSWRCVTLSGFLHSHIVRCRWNPISCVWLTHWLPV